MDVLKLLLFGKNTSLESAADTFYVYDRWAPGIKPEQFNPFVWMSAGGMSFLSNGDLDGENAMRGLTIGNDWLWQCHRAGASTKNALICLASNFDEHMGMVALALELAMIATKPRTPSEIRLEEKAHLDVIKEVFIKDYANIQRMADRWGIGIREGHGKDGARTRSAWRKELGHDVLIHPVTLLPCTDTDGSILHYKGADGNKETGCFFHFVHPVTGQPTSSKQFLPA
jgi:hypothetical protein